MLLGSGLFAIAMAARLLRLIVLGPVVEPAKSPSPY
jgi:hypothetical protein